jgi:hypothetical protein
MTIYYHGTNPRNRRSIEDGWLGTVADPDNMDLSGGETSETGYVFLADNPELAAEYGTCVFAVDTEDAQYWRNCPVTGEKEYIVRADTLNANGAWWTV